MAVEKRLHDLRKATISNGEGRNETISSSSSVGRFIREARGREPLCWRAPRTRRGIKKSAREVDWTVRWAILILEEAMIIEFGHLLGPIVEVST